jgi:hypothetical protein
MDNQKVEVVQQWPVPRTVCAVLGLAGHYRCFIHDYSSIAAPLTKHLCKDTFKWSIEVESTFHAIQQALTSALVLQLSAFDKDFIVECDASGHGFGAVLHQGAGQWRSSAEPSLHTTPS